jgi:hypothetical protein
MLLKKHVLKGEEKEETVSTNDESLEIGMVYFNAMPEYICV